MDTLSLSSVPPDLMQQNVFGCLDVKDLQSSALVCKQWKGWIQGENMVAWKVLEEIYAGQAKEEFETRKNKNQSVKEFAIKTLQLIRESREVVAEKYPQLDQCTEITLMGMKLFTLPAAVLRIIKDLFCINIQNSSLRLIPEEFWENDRIKTITIRFSQVKSLPPSIGRLKDLEHLDLERNQIEHVPPELLDLIKNKKTFYLNLDKNPCQTKVCGVYLKALELIEANGRFRVKFPSSTAIGCSICLQKKSP